MTAPLLSQRIKDFVASYNLDAKGSKILEYYLRGACRSYQESIGAGGLQFTASACSKLVSGGEEFLAGLTELGKAGKNVEAIVSARIFVEGIVALAKATPPQPSPRGNKRNETICTFIFPLMAGYHLAFGKEPTVIKNRHSADGNGQYAKVSKFQDFFQRAVEIITDEAVNIKISTLQDYLKTLKDIFDKNSPYEVAGVDPVQAYEAFLEDMEMPEIQERH